MIAEGQYFYNTGGLIPRYVRYVIFRSGQFELVRTEDELRNIFAPIETSDEALSYTLAAKNLAAYYGLKANSKYRYFVDEIEDTYVKTTTDGYLVHLFHYKVFGCGPHITSIVDIRVTAQGLVEEVRKESVYKNPSEDDVCVD